MVNVVQGDNQAQAVAASQAMAVTGSIDRDLEKAQGKPEDILRQVVETGKTSDVGATILKDLLTKISTAGINLETVAQPAKSSKNREQSKSNMKSEFSDSVSLSSAKDEGEGILTVKGIGKKTGDVKEQINHDWQEIEEQLVEQGKTKQEISRWEQQYKQSQAQKHLLSSLKEAATLYYLDSDKELNKVIRRRAFAEYLEQGGKELGEKAVVDVKDRLKGFVLEKLENQLIARTYSQDSDFKECFKLVGIGEKIDLDCISWLDKYWGDKKENLGLNLLDVPHEVTDGTLVDVKMDMAAHQQKQPFELDKEEEKELWMSRLRALYMQMALNPGMFATVKTWYKIQKLKNGMIKFKIFTQDMEENVKQEAKILAKIKVMEILDEALHELATFYAEGPDKKLAKKKIKSCLKNLERLGFELSDREFVGLKNKADKDIYQVVLREKKKIEAEGKNNKKLEQLKKLAEYLEKELEEA